MNRILILPAAGLLLLLTACGGGSSSTTAAAPPSASGSPVSPTTTAARAPSSGDTGAADSAAGPVDVCRLLPVGDVSRITGVHYTETRSSSTMGQIFGCEYTNSSFGLLQVSLTVVNGSIAYESDVQALTAVGFAPDPVNGVGDKAFAMPDPQGSAGAAGAASFASYGVLFGDRYVSIGGSYVDPGQGRQIAEEIEAGL